MTATGVATTVIRLLAAVPAGIFDALRWRAERRVAPWVAHHNTSELACALAVVLERRGRFDGLAVVDGPDHPSTAAHLGHRVDTAEARRAEDGEAA